MTPKQYADKVLRLTVRLEMMAQATTKKSKAQIRLLQREVAGLLATTDFTTKKVLNSSLRQVRKYTTDRYNEIGALIGEASAAGVEVSAATEATAFASLGTSADAAVGKIVTDKVIEESLKRVMPGLSGGSQVSVGEMMERFESGALNTFMNITRRAQSEGLSIGETTRMVKDASELQGRQAEAVTRTMIQASSNQAREDVAEQLGAEGEMWMATLDGDTCAFCAGLDGECEEVGGIPKPPAHPRCRCVVIYIPEDMTCDEMKEDLTRTYRDPETGKSITAPYQDYGDWIQTQDKDFQEEVLGIERARLLREDKVSFNKMYTASGKQKTVVDLKAHYEPEEAKLKFKPKPKIEPKVEIPSQGPEMINSGTASEAFQAQHQANIDSLPPGMKKEFEDNGVTVVVTGRTTDHRPDLKGVQPRGWPADKDWDNCTGGYTSSRDEFFISETGRSWDNSFTTTHPDHSNHTFFHEAGHAFDEYNSTGKILSDTDDVNILYQRGRDKVKGTYGEHKPDSISYFLQEGVAGPSESVAECMSNILAPEASRNDAFGFYFDELIEYVRPLVK